MEMTNGATEAKAMASDMAVAITRHLDFLRDECGMSPEQIRQIGESRRKEQATLNGPPEYVSTLDLGFLARTDP